MEKIRTLCLVLTLVAVIFAATSIILPWWSVQLSSEARAILNSDFRVDYNLLKTATGTSSENNETAAVSLTNSNMTNAESSSFMVMDVALWFVAGGVVLSIPMIIATITPRIGKHMRYIVVIGFLSAALLFMSTVYFASELPPAVSSLSTLAPIDFPTDWTRLDPKDIVSAWGSKAGVAGSPLADWLKSGNFWVWQPSTGWYLTFSASLLMALASLTLHLIHEQEKRIGLIHVSKILNVEKSITTKNQ
jgi:hypothetical protein